MNNILYRNIVLEEILKMKQPGVKKYANKQLNNMGYETISEDGFLFAKGTYPVLLVAHMDTVHKMPVRKIKYNGPIISSPQGIGGDDRCGVYIILELLKEFNCSVVFTEDEEVGCVGAGKFARSKYIEELNVNYIIEFDRRGSNDCVFYSCDNEDFTSFIESTGYFKTSWGSYSDICKIAPAIGVAAVNLSSGYYSEHTINETINLLELNNIIKEAKRILRLPVEKPFEYVERNLWSFYDGIYDSEYDMDCIPGYKTVLKSKEKSKKNTYHIYISFNGELKCLEVFAVNKMEAIGIVLSRYSFYTFEDIYDIVEGAYEIEAAD